MSENAITCEHVWKIFGDQAAEALTAARDGGLSKKDIYERFGCVVGVADAEFSVREGEIFCIMGLSGSGKSTLVRHVNRLIEPTAGRILIHDQDIGRLDRKQLRAMRADKIGMVFQHMALFTHRSVRENVAFGLEVRRVDKEQRRKVADEKLELVGLAGWGDRRPMELSGGMQQRVGLARALAADPDILLMDEPFSALDPLIRRQLQDQFLELTRLVKKTTIFITHDLDEAIRVGDRVAIMKDGRINQIGTPEEIVMNPGDDYVAEFVQGISRLKLVYARTIMEPLNGDTPDPNSSAEASPDATIDDLLTHFIEGDGPVIVRNGSGPALGVISRRKLLMSIRGET